MGKQTSYLAVTIVATLLSTLITLSYSSTVIASVNHIPIGSFAPDWLHIAKDGSATGARVILALAHVSMPKRIVQTIRKLIILIGKVALIGLPLFVTA